MSATLKSSLKVSGSLMWPRFAPGIVLLDEDLTESINYTRNLSRLLFRSLFGCGVICGFRVKAELECGDLSVTIEPGVALNCHGDPIEMCKPQTLGKDCAEKLTDTEWWVAIRRSGEHSCAPRDVVCTPEEGSSAYEATRSKDCFEIKLFEDPPEGACMCTRTPVATRDQAQSEDSAAPRMTDESSTARRSRARRAEATSRPVEALQSADADRRARSTQQSSAAQNEYDWDCHRDHYCGECGCGCGECGGNCDCCCGAGWVILAKVYKPPRDSNTAPETTWQVDHGVRRFIRPRLAADPLAPANKDLYNKCWPPQQTTSDQSTSNQPTTPQPV